MDVSDATVAERKRNEMAETFECALVDGAHIEVSQTQTFQLVDTETGQLLSGEFLGWPIGILARGTMNRQLLEGVHLSKHAKVQWAFR